MTALDYEAYIRKHASWNFVVNVLDLTFYNLAISFIFGSTVLSLYTSHLTSSATLIGVIPAIQNVGFFLPQLLMARYAERLPRKKPLVQKISVMERVPYLFLALLILLWPHAPAWFSYGTLVLCLGLATFSGGLAGPPWNAMLAKVIPVHRRGLLFGLSSALGGLLGIAGAALSRHILATYPYPISFGFSFLFCFIFQVCSWVCLSLNREPPREPGKAELTARAYWQRLPRILRENPNFARYLLSRTLIILGGMAGGFYVIYARRAFQISDAFAANLTIAALVSQTLCTPILGWLADRRGRKWLTELGSAGAAGALILALLSRDPAWFYGVFALMSAANAGLMVAGMTMVMDFSSPEDLPTFTALANTVLAIPILVAPMLGGRLADTVGYQALFGIALALSALGWATMRWTVREPRQELAPLRSSEA
jgi:MFS family permease